MGDPAAIFAKLAGLHKTIHAHLSSNTLYFDPPDVLDHFARYARLRDELKSSWPELYSDLPTREAPPL
ncbi:MAG TPA: hypothetical protein VEI97_17850, partial [bacterium]|nr:hypothetical protein [bacterium]